MDNIDALADSVFAAVKGYLERVAADIRAEIKALPPGKDGTNGADGKDGEPGKPGDNGKDADIGQICALLMPALLEKIPPAIPGKDGTNGKDGIDGKSVVADDVAAILLPELVKRIPEPVHGKDGANGKDGTDGKSVAAEEVATLVLPELVKHIPAPIPGRDGHDAVDGRDGKQGPAGRDALQIEPLPMIDPAKVYARGTYANHEGGMIRAVRNTDPLDGHDLETAGWEVTCRGVHMIEATLAEDGRTIKFATMLTGAKQVMQEIKVAALLDKGIYRDGIVYEKGDVVTRDGSMWIAQQEAPAGAPGASDHWRLAVKRGQNGKDGKDGTRGEKGESGRAGVDLTHMGSNGARY